MAERIDDIAQDDEQTARAIIAFSPPEAVPQNFRDRKIIKHNPFMVVVPLNREEMAFAQDLGEYFRIPVDARDLNYNKYFVEGEEQISGKEDYTSNNTRILGIEEIKEVLLKVGFIQDELSRE